MVTSKVMTNMGMLELCGAHESRQQGESVLCLLDQCLETCCNVAEGPAAAGSAQQFLVVPRQAQQAQVSLNKHLK